MTPLEATLAIPGALETPTGGYAYARGVLEAGAGAGLALTVLGLPASFPFASAADVRAAAAALAGVPADRPVLLDGLVGGALPPEAIAGCPAPVVMLCHHPLAREAGLTAGQRARLAASERAALGAAAHVVTTSEATAAILVADYGVGAGRITVARPGTDPAPRAAGTDGCAILSVGSVTPRKRHPMLLRALAGCADLAWSLRILGAVPDPAALDALGALASDLGLEDRVALRGPCPRSELDAQYAASDLFVLASEYEGYGMAFTEAMAHGLPVLGIATGAVAEATRGGAMLVGDEAFGAALRTLIADAGARRTLADRCRAAAEGFGRWSDTAQIIRAVLASAR